MNVAADARFDALIEEYYQAWFRFHPEQATLLGYPGYDGLSQRFGDDEIGALIKLNEMLLEGLQNIDTTELSVSRCIDYYTLYGAVAVENRSLNEADWRYHDPGAFLPLDVLETLLRRDGGGAMTDAVLAHIQGLPDLLRQAKTYIQQTPDVVPALWCHAGVLKSLTAEIRLRQLLDQEANHAQSVMAEAIVPAAQALSEFAGFLEADIMPECNGELACGEDYYHFLVRHVFQLDCDLTTLHRFGQEMADEAREMLLAILPRFGDDYQTIAAGLQSICDYKRQAPLDIEAFMDEAYDFLQETGAFELPDKASLRVNLNALSGVQGDFYVHQSKDSATDITADLYLTPCQVADNSRRVVRPLRQRCLTLGWPGKHLQATVAHSRFHSRRLPRGVNASALLQHGWTLYAEAFMLEAGFLADPADAFLFWFRQLYVGQRLMLDIDLHVNDLEFDAAVEIMVEELGLPYTQALMELTEQTRHPSLAIAEGLGYYMIREARKSVEEHMPLAEFHRRLLTHGDASLPLVLKHEFGAECWERVECRVLKEH